MFQHYDITGAAAALSAITENRINSPHSQLQLAKLFATDGSPYRVEKDGAIWRLMFNPSSKSVQDDATEEVVASIQGILCRNGLPPFLDQIGTNSANSTRFLRQSARITGYGNKSFENLTADIAGIQALFKRAVGPQLLDEAGFSHHDGFTAIDASNRYFTLKSELNQNDGCAITDEMDPKRYLRKAAGNTYIHTEENKVHYFEMCEDNAGTSFKKTGPHTFQEGDIVELQVSFIVVPLRDQKSRMNIVLRSISLLNGKYTQEAFVKAMSTGNELKQNAKATLKRKVGYLDEEASATRTKFAQLKITRQRDGDDGDDSERMPEQE